MARAKSCSLAVKKKRLEFSMSKKPRFESLGDGVSLGYRRNQGAGTWVARKADGQGGSTQRGIGFADDFQEADGERAGQTQVLGLRAQPPLEAEPEPVANGRVKFRNGGGVQGGPVSDSVVALQSGFKTGDGS